MSTDVTYCTILSSNYLPKALALAESLRRHHDGAELHILFTDIPRDEDLPVLDGVRCLSTDFLGLDGRTLNNLVMGYDLVEFATAVKPVLLQRLLERTEQVFYLDPDTYVTSPMVELSDALTGSEGGILLTPHFLHPADSEWSKGEGHLLTVGVFNLGFCGVDTRAREFLGWWWGHLSDECLYDPLSGLFVDQKWMDIGATLWRAAALRHSGYNVGVGNLPERPLAQDDAGFYNSANGERTRLFHFHAFDAHQPEILSVRFAHSRDRMGDDSAIRALCKEYAELVVGFEEQLPTPQPYPYWTDSGGRRISRQLRRAYRIEAQSQDLPSPFDPQEAEAFVVWRRQAWKVIGRAILGDTAKGVRVILPEEYDRARGRFPGAVGKLKSRFASGVGMWR
jgi:hypothetical protein